MKLNLFGGRDIDSGSGSGDGGMTSSDDVIWADRQTDGQGIGSDPGMGSSFDAKEESLTY